MRWYTGVRMPTANSRVQVTVDTELAAALAEIDPSPRSRSRLIRDMALRGVEAEREEREAERRREAREHLLKIVRGQTDYAPASALAAHAEREASV